MCPRYMRGKNCRGCQDAKVFENVPSAILEGLAQDTIFWENIKAFKISDNRTKCGFLKEATHFTGSATHI